jgi:translation initiation factor 3 subunit C
MEARGRKSTDRTEQVAILQKLLTVAESSYQKLRVLLALIAARFDYNATANNFMPLDMWNAARTEVDQLVQTLAADRSYVVREDTEDYDDSIDRVPGQNGEGSVVAVRGSIISFVDRLDDEFTKHLQNLDPHSTEYLERLRDERFLYATIVRAQSYLENAAQTAVSGSADSSSQTDALARVVMRRLEHVYSKQAVIIQALESASASTQEDAEKVAQASAFPTGAGVASSAAGPSQLVRALCVHLYKAPGLTGERLRTRAMLCHIYNTALQADYYVARDMLLMSHLQDSIALADAATQILYNRSVVQIGLCAFRLGLIKEAHAALSDIFAAGRVKELLAQGVQRSSAYASISPEQEKLDKQRQLPFHLHINLELLESAYLVCSMLLEVPHMARAGSDPDQRRKVLSRPFRRMLDYTDRQVFSGPPESARDHIMQATKALQVGDWRESSRLIGEIKIWKLLSSAADGKGGEESVKALLSQRIQEEGLRTYLFSYNAYYTSVSMQHLASTFDLSLSQVRSIVSRMIWNEEIAASLDSSPGVEGPIVVLHREESSKVHQLAQTLAERASSMLDQNERLLDAKMGDGPGGNRDGADGGKGKGEREGGREGGGDRGGRREGRRGGAGGRGGGGRGRGRGRTQFQALPGQVAAGR